jgi:hypothetical protein
LAESAGIITNGHKIERIAAAVICTVISAGTVMVLVKAIFLDKPDAQGGLVFFALPFWQLSCIVFVGAAVIIRHAMQRNGRVAGAPRSEDRVRSPREG